MAERERIYRVIEGGDEAADARDRLDQLIKTFDKKNDVYLFDKTKKRPTQSKEFREAIELARLTYDDAMREYRYINELEMGEYRGEEYIETTRTPTPDAEKERRKKLEDRGYFRGERNLAEAMEDRSEIAPEETREYKVRERRRRQRENRKARRLRNADLTKLGNLFADGKADVTSAVNGLVSMYSKAAASGGGAAFIASLADDLFEDNKKAAGKFFNLIKSNPAAAFQMAGKGLMAMAMDGLPLTAALAVMMPTPVNDDEEELLATVMEDPQQNYIDTVLDQHRDKNFVQRILLPELSPTPISVDGQPATHMMSAEFLGEGDSTPAVFPMIVARDDGLVQLSKEEAMDEARRTGNYIPFETIESANTFSQIYKGGKNSKFNKFYNGTTAAEKMFGADTPDGVNEHYAKNFLPSIRNEFDYDLYPASEYTTDTVSPEFKGYAKTVLDNYFAQHPEADAVDLADGLLGQKDRSALNTMTAMRNNDGSYKIIDRYNVNQNFDAEFDTSDIAQSMAQSMGMEEEGSQGWIANQMTEDDIVIDIDIPSVLPVVSNQVDAPFAFEEGAVKSRFNNAPLTYERHQKLNSMLNIINGVNRGKDTSMDTQGGQEPEGGIERSGSGILQEGDAQATS